VVKETVVSSRVTWFSDGPIGWQPSWRLSQEKLWRELASVLARARIFVFFKKSLSSPRPLKLRACFQHVWINLRLLMHSIQIKEAEISLTRSLFSIGTSQFSSLNKLGYFWLYGSTKQQLTCQFSLPCQWGVRIHLVLPLLHYSSTRIFHPLCSSLCELYNSYLGQLSATTERVPVSTDITVKREFKCLSDQVWPSIWAGESWVDQSDPS